MDSTSHFWQAFYAYLNTGMVDRNLDAIANLLSEGFCAFGTAADEKITNRAEGIELFCRDFDAAPHPLEYTLHCQELRMLGCDAAVIMAVLDLAGEIAGQRIRLNNLRMTLVLQREPDGIKAVNHHISFPTSVHGEEEPYPLKELEERADVLRRLVSQRTKDLEKAYRNLASVVNFDPLTKLSSRYFIEQQLDIEHQRWQRFGHPYTVLLLDLDNFKQVNDTHGHTVGDHVLQTCGKLLTNYVRSADLAARWGGDEFLLLLAETTLDRAAPLAERLQQAARKTAWPNGASITFSIGTAEASGETWQQVFDHADLALYRAKKTRPGRTKVNR